MHTHRYIQVTWLVVTEVRSASAHGECYYYTIMLQCYLWVSLLCCKRYIFIVECGIAHFLCTTRVFEVRHYPHHLGYLCAKFHFFRELHCWASPWRKIVYSITHSLTHPAYLIPRKRSTCTSNITLWYGITMLNLPLDTQQVTVHTVTYGQNTGQNCTIYRTNYQQLISKCVESKAVTASQL